ncbi:MAG: nucleotide sugar dehydrogenase [Acidimicrobiia bacterium]|nr:nucleotide sugar dehydrogenase [Acidimicrobiia bacterium]
MPDRISFFEHETWTAGVIGLGYVGLPLAVNAVQRGLRAVGFDVDKAAVARLRGGRSPVEDVSDEALQEALGAGLEVTTDESRLAEADALFICVPSPLNRHREPDMRFIEAAADTVRRVVRPGMLVSLESTTYPGTTEDLLVPAATASGLLLDDEVFVCFSSERVDPGRNRELGSIPKVVGGVTPASTRVAAAAYGRLVERVHAVSSARAAEMSKLLENTYRAVNIGLVNEMAQLAHELDIDIWEVIAAAATKPFGFQPFYPGPGVGGHCIPLDPNYLAWRAREAGFATRFIDLAEQVNTRMPAYTADRITELLNQRGLPVFGTRILGVGLAFKPDVADDRESPAVDVLELLAGRGAEVLAWDPLVGPGRIASYGFTPVDGGMPKGVALAVILTDHELFDYPAIAAAVPVVFDTRGAYSRRGLAADNVVTL